MMKELCWASKILNFSLLSQVQQTKQIKTEPL
jgi:hypothetical protein